MQQIFKLGKYILYIIESQRMNLWQKLYKTIILKSIGMLITEVNTYLNLVFTFNQTPPPFHDIYLACIPICTCIISSNTQFLY